MQQTFVRNWGENNLWRWGGMHKGTLFLPKCGTSVFMGSSPSYLLHFKKTQDVLIFYTVLNWLLNFWFFPTFSGVVNKMKKRDDSFIVERAVDFQHPKYPVPEEVSFMDFHLISAMQNNEKWLTKVEMELVSTSLFTLAYSLKTKFSLFNICIMLRLKSGNFVNTLYCEFTWNVINLFVILFICLQFLISKKCNITKNSKVIPMVDKSVDTAWPTKMQKHSYNSKGMQLLICICYITQ